MAKRKNVGSMPTSKLRTFNTWDEFEAATRQDLEQAIKQFAENDAKEIMQEVINENVYQAYTPVCGKRRGDNGGLLDTEHMYASLDRNGASIELVMTDYAPWQNFKVGYHMPRKSLADAVETGACMHGAGARPFYRDVEQKISERLEADINLYFGI